MKESITRGIVKGYYKAIVTTLAISLVASFFVFVNTNIENHSFLFLIPLLFSILSIFFIETLCKIYPYFSFKIIYFQSIIRYIIIPVLIALNFDLGRGRNSHNMDTAVLIMLLEMISVFIGFYIVKRKLAAVHNVDPVVKYIKVNFLICIVLGVGLLYLVSNPTYFLKSNFFWELGDYVSNYEAKELANSTDSFVGLFFFRFRALILLLIISVTASLKNVKTNVKLFLIITIVLLNSSIIIGASRLSILFFIIPFVMLLVELYPNHRKKFYTIGFVGMLTIIIFSSINKFSAEKNSVQEIDQLVTLESLNAYFSGLGNIAIGIDIYEKKTSGTGYIFLFNDVFQNVPGVAGFTSSEFKTNTFFNYEIYGSRFVQDQIVPLTVTGLFHFGFFLSFLYSLIFLFLSFYFELKGKQSSWIVLKYSYFLLCFSCALFMMLNIGSLFSNLFSHIVLTMFPFYMLQKVGLIKIKAS